MLLNVLFLQALFEFQMQIQLFQKFIIWIINLYKIKASHIQFTAIFIFSLAPIFIVQSLTSILSPVIFIVQSLVKFIVQQAAIFIVWSVIFIIAKSATIFIVQSLVVIIIIVQSAAIIIAYSASLFIILSIAILIYNLTWNKAFKFCLKITMLDCYKIIVLLIRYSEKKSDSSNP